MQQTPGALPQSRVEAVNVSGRNRNQSTTAGVSAHLFDTLVRCLEVFDRVPHAHQIEFFPIQWTAQVIPIANTSRPTAYPALRSRFDLR